MTARVVFTSGFSRLDGVREFTVEAKNLRGVIKAMDELYPTLGEHLVEETTVAIDGVHAALRRIARPALAARRSDLSPGACGTDTGPCRPRPRSSPGPPA
jgi:hypothetical protein